jgi:hypothetical protein
MRRNNFLIAAMAILFCFAGAFGQTAPANSDLSVGTAWLPNNPDKRGESNLIGSGSVRRDKYIVFWESRIEPATPPMADSFVTRAVTDASPVIHRVMIDNSGRTYFGYDVLVEVRPEPHTYRVTFTPLNMPKATLQSQLNGSEVNWGLVAPPRFPPPRTVHSDEILEVALLTNSTTKQKILDYISIQEPGAVPINGLSFSRPPSREFSYATGDARDFTANDVQMRIDSPRVAISGKLEESTASRSDIANGVFIWLYIPKRGRIVLSLGPHADLGFRKAGEVRGTSLQFALGTETFTISSGSAIAPGAAAFNLYVLQQQNWKPTYPFADLNALNIGAVNRFDALEK